MKNEDYTKWTKRKMYVENIFDYSDKDIISKSNVRVYRNCPLLTEGAYVDGLSRTKAFYSNKVLNDYGNNHIDKVWLDIDHNVMDILSRIGEVDIKGFKNNAVTGDLKIYKITQNAKDTVALIDNGLVTDLSVEILTKDKWNSEKEYYDVLGFVITGIGVVVKGACPSAKINNN